MGKSKFQISRSLDEKIRRIIAGPGENDNEFSLVTSGYILGFNYGNVTNCVGLTTNYQLHHAVFPVVGLAFFRRSPTDEEIKASLKAITHYSSSPNGLGSFKSDKNEHLFLIYCVDENTKQVDKRIFNFSKGAFVRRKSHRLEILNDPFCPRNVYNGSEDTFNLNDNDSTSSTDDDQIDHLIFFIHGVGGVCDVRFRSCVEVVADFKKMANTLLALHSNPSSGTSTPTTNRQLARSLKKGFFRKQSTDSTTSRGSDMSDSSPTPRQRIRKVECLPISWHSLTRRQTGFSEQLNQISLSSVPKLRQFLNKVVMDAMLYSTGPVYTQTILNNVGNEINRLYTLFMERHPNFSGSVSLAGHSLGSVIVFDLLAHQIPELHADPASSGKQRSNDEEARVANSETENSSNQIPETNTEATTTCDERNHRSSGQNNNHNHNNNNDNNNNGPHKTAASFNINTRQRCLNVAHDHRCVTPGDQRYCSDYINLEELLKDMDLTKYAEMFQREHIDLNSLLLLTDLDLKELQLPLGVRRKLGTYINFKRAFNVASGGAGLSGHSSSKNYPETTTTTMTRSNAPTAAQTTTTDGLTNEPLPSKPPPKAPPPSCNPFGNMNTGQALVEYPQLKFKPRCFFSFGSPTTMFLNVRGIQELSGDYKLPTCDRMLNIFHPYDPLAYRFEPLIDARFKDIEPVLIPHHRGGKRMHVQLREGFAKVGHDIKHRIFGSLKNTWTSFTRMGGTAGVSPEPSLSSSISAELRPAEESTATVKRQRLSFTAAHPSSCERDSFETCSSNLSGGGGGGRINCDPTATKESQQSSRNPLRRQNELRRSQSENAGGACGASSTPMSLSSIIESSINDSSFGQADDESNLADGGAGTAYISRKLKTCKLVEGQEIKVEAGVETSSVHNPQRMSGRSTATNSIDECEIASETCFQAKDSEGLNNADETTRVGRLNNGRRIDFVLQEKPIELFNEYIFAFTSHANYWANEDSALIILKEIYQVDGVHLVEQTD